MISFNEAFEKVMGSACDFGTESVKLLEAEGKILSEDIMADRDYPPFNRATKDGIAIKFAAFEAGRTQFEVKGVIAAGTPVTQLADQDSCMEIMTGAVVPDNADTVIMYEHIEIDQGIAKLMEHPQRGQNIHPKGSDEERGAVLIEAGKRISAAEVGVLATVGLEEVQVKKLPKVAVISTGNELVSIDTDPLPHQIRRSNTYSLYSSLEDDGITPILLHLEDDVDIIREKLQFVMEEMQVILLSGGVSKGKFDFIPQVLEELGVEKVFHGVLQRPGKPFWFGVNHTTNTKVFSFPGNPVSTFVNYHVYFRNWLFRSLGQDLPFFNVFLSEPIEIKGDLTRFIRVKTHWIEDKLGSLLVKDNGSGDLISLVHTDGFIRLEPREGPYKTLDRVPFIPTRRLM